MKKILFTLTVIVLAASIILIFLLRSSSGFRSIYFVPSDALAIFEASDPTKAWDKIIHSEAWNHLSSNELIKELNNNLQSYDSLVNSNKILLKLIGQKKITVSQHFLGNNKYEFIYIIDAGKVGKMKNPVKLINSVLGKDFEVTSRDYKGTSIVELYDKANSNNYFVVFSEGKIIFSFEPKLIEKSLDAVEEKEIGLNTKYLHVQSKIGSKGLLTVYLNYENLGYLVNSLSAESAENYKEKTKYLGFSGISFDIDQEGLITLESYTSFTDDAPENYFEMLTKGNSKIYSIDVIPQRLASLAKINFDDASDYFESAMRSMGENEYATYTSNISKFEKKMKIDLKENLYNWMDKEIVMLQTQPSNLGRDNEFAVLLHAKDSLKAATNLQFMWKQIKKNTPVKMKSVIYKNHNIDYIAFPGIIKTLFGKTLEKLEKPYFTQIGDNVILSNHPQTLKNIIDDYDERKNLGSSLGYYDFMKNFDNESSSFIYFEPPVLYHNLRAIVDAETWNKIKKNKKYITCFNQGGVGINKSGDLMHIQLKIQYKPEQSEWNKQRYNYTEIISLFNTPETQIIITDNEKAVSDTIPNIIITDLDARKHVEYFDDGTLKLEVELKNGLKHGNIKEYHSNGELRLKGEYDEDVPKGKWKYYNEEGDLIKVDKY